MKNKCIALPVFNLFSWNLNPIFFLFHFSYDIFQDKSLILQSFIKMSEPVEEGEILTQCFFLLISNQLIRW